MTLSLADIYAARRTIRGRGRRDAAGALALHVRTARAQDFLLKLENCQPIGAFKLRGALNAVAALPEGTAGVTCCSTGNHGRGVAYAAREKGLRAVVCMSELVPQAKVDGIRALGAEVRIVGRSQDDAQAECRRLVEEEGLAEISPFDDAARDRRAGHHRAGDARGAARPRRRILVPLSGGGLAAGVALAAKAIRPDIRVDRRHRWTAARPCTHSIRAGHPVEVEEVASLADSLGGGIGMDNRLLLPDVPRPAGRGRAGHRGRDLPRHADALLRGPASWPRAPASSASPRCWRARSTAPTGRWRTIVTGRNLDMEMFTRVVTGQDVHAGRLHAERPPPMAHEIRILTEAELRARRGAGPVDRRRDRGAPSARSPGAGGDAADPVDGARRRRMARSTSRPPTSPASTASRSRSRPGSSTTRSWACPASTG